MNNYNLLLSDLWKEFRFRLVGLIAVIVVTGLTEGLAVALLLPLLSRLGITSTPGSGALSDWLLRLDAALGSGSANLVLVISGVAIVQALLVLLQGWITAHLAQSYSARWKIRLFSAFIHADWLYLMSMKAGRLINIITNETGRLSAAAMNLLNLVAVTLVGLIYIAYGLALAPAITGAILVMAAILILLLGRLYRMSFRIGDRIGPLQAEQQVVVGEFLQGAKAVKAAAIEDQAVEKISTIVGELERSNIWSAFLPHVVRAVFESGGIIVLVILLVLSVTWMHEPLANLLVTIALFLRLFPRLSSLQQYIHSVNSFIPAVAETIKLATEAELRSEVYGKLQAPAYNIPSPTKLVFSDVGVVLDEKAILSSVNFAIPVPGVTAIVGSSGAGKSTMLAGLLRLVPISGDIAVEKHSILEIPLREWRRSIGFVPQEPIFFHATIRENLSIGRPDKGLEDIVKAAQRAQLHSFIMSLPDGYETIIGDQGLKLSGGQRQRLGLARSLLGDPKILVLDEPTSALDSLTENAVLDAIYGLKNEIGVVIVAHRLSSVRRADQIVLLENGRIIGTGKWDDLMAQSSRFNTYATAQHIS